MAIPQSQPAPASVPPPPDIEPVNQSEEKNPFQHDAALDDELMDPGTVPLPIVVDGPPPT